MNPIAGPVGRPAPLAAAAPQRPQEDAFAPAAADAPADVFEPVAAAAGNSQTFDLKGVTLKANAPHELTGVDPSRPIVGVDVETADGRAVTVKVGRDAQRGQRFEQPTFGTVTLNGDAKLTRATVRYAEPSATGSSDYYSLADGKNGLANGKELSFPTPANRKGMDIQNIDVSFHAPVRQWNKETGREEKPTYCTWYVDDKQLMRKFVDPNQDAGNIPEIDNIHPVNNGAGAGVLAPAGKRVRVVAENTTIPADEQAMTVQWVRVTYKPKNVEESVVSFRGEKLPNQEWKGRWVPTGQSLSIPVDPQKKISRVEVQWSDKPDDVPFDKPGKWAKGTLTLDGKVLGKPGEEVGSPEWQFFEGGGAQGKSLSLTAQSSPIKVFEVKTFYEK